MRPLLFIVLGFGFLHGRASSIRYLRGCPDTAEIKGLYGLAKFEQIVSEIDAFREKFRIMPKPCFAVANLYYGLSKYTLQDEQAGQVSWETLLQNEPQMEIFNLGLPLPLQWRFDEIKLRLFRQGAIQNAFGPDYIPPAIPQANDGPELTRLKTLFHNARLDAYAGDLENSKAEIREYMAQCEKKKLPPDAALLLAKGEIISRSVAEDRGLILQASLAVEAGLDLNKKKKSRVTDSLLLMRWGDRILERLATPRRIQAGR